MTVTVASRNPSTRVDSPGPHPTSETVAPVGMVEAGQTPVDHIEPEASVDAFIEVVPDCEFGLPFHGHSQSAVVGTCFGWGTPDHRKSAHRLAIG